ncbi:MAG: helix-turn-helix transcriptional regulator [Thermotogaceae bacterium]|nr:helix-turn-helix transcriptional regulator [Thermotogaceae bacterium]
MELTELSDILKILGHPLRLKVLLLLKKNGEMCVCELLSLLNVTQPNLSQHLSVMRLSGLIGGTKDGNTVKYKLANNEFLHKVLEVVEKFSEVEVKTRWKN